jgi:hypothetical protein
VLQPQLAHLINRRKLGALVMMLMAVAVTKGPVAVVRMRAAAFGAPAPTEPRHHGRLVDE